MSRIDDILLRVRDTLADPLGDRWPTDRLLRLVDEAQKDICRRAKLLRTKVDIPVYEGQATYTLPNNLLLLDRVLFNTKALPLIDHVKMDEKDLGWETDIGNVSAVIFDKQNRSTIKLYPIPVVDTTAGEYEFVPAVWLEDIEYNLDNYGIITQGEIGDVVDSDYGITSDIDSLYYVYVPPNCSCDNLMLIEDDISSDFGLVSEILTLEKDFVANDSSYGVTVSIDNYAIDYDFGVLATIKDEDFSYENFNSDFGILTSWTVSNSLLTIYYLKKPNTITDVTDELEIDDIFDNAIKYYVTGKALRDDMDTQNRIVGNEELNFYTRELQEAITDDFLDFTRNDGKQYYVSYKGGI